jgi:hypothetical protein
MTSAMENVRGRTGGVCRRLLTAVAIGAGASALCAAPALAKQEPNPEFAAFSDCPIKVVPKISDCVVAQTTSGEFKMGSKTVTINKTITLQGGVREGSEELVPAADGNTLSKTPLTVPGGLTGVEGVGGEVTATTELTGPVLINEANLFERTGAAVTMPVRVKLSNPALGEECYIGSNAEPIVLKLTSGTTNPPAPNTPISGSPGELTVNEAGNLATVSGATLVDNSFAAPGVTGCGEPLSALLDPVIDLAAGLPSAEGNNTAILNSSFQEASLRAVKKAHVTPKVKKTKGT